MTTTDHAQENAKGWLVSIEDMLAEFNAADEGNEDCPNDRHEKAEQVIHESVLAVQVRDSWRDPGEARDRVPPDEFMILLTTGGPALRIIGRLDDYSNPTSAELQYQDWGTPWTRYPAPEATLLEFAQCFYFGG